MCPLIMKVERVAECARFARLKKEWNELLSRSGQKNPFLTHQWFDAWWKSFGRDKTLEILLVRDELGDLVGLGPLMVSDSVLSFMASPEVTDYCDFICQEECRENFYKILLGWLQKKTTDFSRMEFINIPAGSPSLSEFPRLASTFDFVCETAESEVVPSMSLPDSFENYLISLDRKNRHELRRKIRKLESIGPVRIRRVTDPSNINEAVQQFISLHKSSSPSKKDFWQKEGMSEFFQGLVSLFSLEKWVEIYLLSVEERIIGGLVNFRYEDHLFLYNSAYDDTFSSLSPGFYLFSHSIKQAIEEGRKTADFLRGGEKYKYFLGAKDSRIYTLRLRRKARK